MPCASVHQLHQGPASAAIILVMAAIRDRLRKRGFDSDIFAADGDAARDIYPAGQLPNHAGQVVLVHHSTAAAPYCTTAPQILLWSSAEAGLIPLDTRFVAALAATEPLSITLRKLGVPAVRTCAALFDPARQDLAAFWRAIAFAGAVPRADAASRRAMAANLHFTIAGHVAKTYSLAAVNRDLSRTLDAHRPGCVRLSPVEGEPTADLSEVPAQDAAWVSALTERRFATGIEIVISSHYPVHVPEHRGDAAMALFFWEESLIPAETVARLNRHFAGVLAPSGFVARTLVNSGVTIPVLNVGQAPRLQPFTQGQRRHAGPFTFLHVSSGFPRKGLDLLLAAWGRAFSSDAAVRLVLKTFPNPHNDGAARLERFRCDHPAAPPIALIDREIDEAEMTGLFAAADAVVLPTRGEGYNLVAAEALAAGLPLLVTGFGGHMDFVAAGLIRFRFARSESHLAVPGSLWVEPDVDALASLMDDVAARPWRSDAEAMLTHAEPAAFVARLADAAVELLLTPKLRPIRVAWVTPWDTGCPVASYSQTLLAALPREGIEHLIILCEHDASIEGGRVQPCWRPGSTAGIAAMVRAHDSDFVMVQHHPELRSWAELAALLGEPALAQCAVAVTLHGDPDPQWQHARAALQLAARVLVPTIAGMNALVDLGLADAAVLSEPDARAERLHGMMLGLVAQLRAKAPLDGSLWQAASPAG